MSTFYKKCFTAIEAIVITFFVLTDLDYSHYTWWAVTTYDLFLLSYLVDASKLLWGFSFLCSLWLVLGVLFMSATGCGMLKHAAEDNGPFVYVVGNFFIHYWPMVGIVVRFTEPHNFTSMPPCCI